MQTIQLKTEEYQLAESTENLFQLKPLPSQSSFQIDLEYNFAPLYCPKTEKIIRTLPSISDEKSNSTLFHTEIDVQFNLKSPPLNVKNTFDSCKSMRNLGEIEKAILVPKPLSHYCQICRETFSDYLQHINHSSHQKKLKQGAVTNNDFIEIQSILKKKSLFLEKKQNDISKKNKMKGALSFNEPEVRTKLNYEQKQFMSSGIQNMKKKISETQFEGSSKFLRFEQEEEDLYSTKSFGSKKRIIVNNEGGHESMTVLSQRLIKEEISDFKTPSLKKLGSLRTIDDKDESHLSDFIFDLTLN